MFINLELMLKKMMINLERFLLLYSANYAVFKKIKCNSYRNLISGRDNVEEIPEIYLLLYSHNCNIMAEGFRFIYLAFWFS